MTAHASIVVPVKGLAGGKTRLAGVLDDDERTALVRRLAERTLAVARELPDTNIYVVSPDPEALDTLAVSDVHSVRQHGEGLNAALEEVARILPATRMIVVPTDLPELCADDIERHRDCDGVGLSPDERDRGTNMLSLPAPAALPFRFGPDSFAEHRRVAGEAGLAVHEIRSPGLCFDLDTRDDLARLKVWR